MIDYETFAHIKHLHDHKGLEPAQISRELGLDLRTVSRWLEEKRFRARLSTAKPSILDPFKDSIVRMLESYPYTARRIYQRLRSDGFNGSYSVVKRFVRKVKPSRQKAYLRVSKFGNFLCPFLDVHGLQFTVAGELHKKLPRHARQPVTVNRKQFLRGPKTGEKIQPQNSIFGRPRPISPSPLRPVNALRWIGAPMARSGWARPSAV